MIEVDKSAIQIIKLLEDNGYEAYFVGGFVRDSLLGKLSTDIDIVTNASPEIIEDIFTHNFEVNLVGKKFGVVIIDGYEVATYRSDKYIIPGKPEVKFVSSFYEDSSRRDFTINAMGMNLNGEVIDFHRGKEDLCNGILRSVGNPEDRFREDESRILRALYLSSTLKTKDGKYFLIEENTLSAIKSLHSIVAHIPNELIGKIVQKVINKNALHRFILLLHETNTLQYVFPEISHTYGVIQNPKYHCYDVFGHIVKVVEAAQTTYPSDIVMALSALYHDNRKGIIGIRGVNKDGFPNDIGHEEAGVSFAKNGIIRLQFGKEIASIVGFIINFHGVRLSCTPKKSTVIKYIRKMSLYFKNKDQLSDGIEKLFNFMYLDASGFQSEFQSEITQFLPMHLKLFREVLQDTIFYRNELPINGEYLVKLGFTGLEIKNILEELVLDNLKDISDIQYKLQRKYNI